MDPIAAAIEATKAEWSVFFDGAREDAHKFLEAMVTDLATAKIAGDASMANTLEAQFRALAEAQRLRAKQASWTIAFAWIRAAVRAALLVAGKPA